MIGAVKQRRYPYNMSNSRKKQNRNACKRSVNKNTKNKNIVLISVVLAIFLIIAVLVLLILNRGTDVYIDFTVDGEVIYSGTVKLDKFSPTVLDAVALFAKENKIDVTYDSVEFPTTVVDFADYKETKNAVDGLWYFWEFGVNDISVYDISGRAGGYTVYDGDEIHWYYSAIPWGEGVYDEEYLY